MSRDHALSCRQMAEQLSDYLDGELAASFTAFIDAHLRECPPCEAFIRTLEKSIQMIRAQPREPLSPALRKRLVEALRRVPGGPSGS